MWLYEIIHCNGSVFDILNMAQTTMSIFSEKRKLGRVYCLQP